MTVLAATGLLDTPGAVVTGTSTLAGADSPATQLVAASPRLLRSVHGGRIGFVFQDPGTSLNPLLSLARQITESLETHRNMTRRQANARAIELLEAVGLPDPQMRLHAYPHQLSGGQRQRVMIAIALACDPELLIADEPTTSLDVTTQAQIIELVRDLQQDFGTAVVWISHDLGVIGQVARDVTVLRDGVAVEQGPILDVFDEPQNPYTRELLVARPLVGRSKPSPAPDDVPVLLHVEGLDVRFDVSTPLGRSTVHAVKNLSFDIRRRTTLGLVGESGSGKSTVAATLAGLVNPDAGVATLDGADVFGVRGSAQKALRRRIGLVFQDPFSSLDPRRQVGTAIGEPLSVHRLVRDKRERAARVSSLLELVGLPTSFASRYPHELSGGQRQRVSIARALAAEPELLILDESTASLDVSVQARVLDLLTDLQRELGLTYLFIGHDLAVIQQMSHDVLVMRDGEAVEYRSAADLFADPRQEYTRALLAAVPPARPRVAA
jgi:peptide/nickel transport system ATP-binding protein